MRNQPTIPQRILLSIYYVLVMLPAWAALRYINFSADFLQAFCAAWFAFWLVDTLRGKL